MTLNQAKMPQHVVAIPYPAQGHITPMLQLCRQLAPHGFTFTFVNTHHIHQRVQHVRRSSPARGVHGSDQYDALAHPDEEHHSTREAHTDGALAHDDSNQSEQGRGTHDHCNSIRMVFVAGGCPPEEHGRQSTSDNGYKAADEMQQHVEQLLSHIMQEQAVAFILSDIMFSWSSSTAHKFSLPWVVFWPASAATFSTLLYFSDLAANGKGIPISENEAAAAGSTMIEGIPGLPPTRLCDVPKVWNTNTGKLEHLVLRSFHPAALKEASYLILNTFEELESQVLQALRNYLPTVAVGPLLPSHYMQRLHKNNLAARRADPTPEAPLSLFPEDSTCLTWLDTQSPSSVLYISFGSISLRTERQLQELALGVQASGCPFLWVCRPSFDTCADKSFTGYCCEAGRPQPVGGGLIVAWAPQLQVLSHPSVGGFITHCGWNSVMESVAMGVPMLCWADTGERMSNQRFVVEFWKCGMHMVTSSKRVVQHIDEAVLVGQDEVENSVRQLMYEEAGALVRARATELRAISKGAFVDAASRKGLVEAMELKRPTHGCT